MSITSFGVHSQNELAAALAAIAAQSATIGGPIAYTIVLTGDFAIAGTLTADLANGAASLTVANNGHVISGTGSLTKTGAGSLILAGNNVFTGGIDLTSGTLELASRGAAGAGVLRVASNYQGPEMVLRIDGPAMPINRIDANFANTYRDEQPGYRFHIHLPNIHVTTQWGTASFGSQITLPTTAGSITLDGNWGNLQANYAFPVLDDGAGGTLLFTATYFTPRHPVIVLGIAEAPIAIAFDDAMRNDTVQTAIADPISAGIIAGTVTPWDMATGLPPTVPGTLGMILHTAAAIAMPDTLAAVISDAAGAISVIGGAANGTVVLTGLGGLTYLAGSGQGSVVAGGGNSVIYIPTGAIGQYVDLGAGDDTIVATGGTNLLSPGRGHNIVWLGAGANYVKAEGRDTIVGGAGNALIDATRGLLGADVMAWLGPAGSSFYAGAGRSTVVAGAGADTIQTSTGPTQIWLGSGADQVLSLAADTIIAGTGSATVSAYADAAVYGGAGALDFTDLRGYTNKVSTLIGGSGPTIARNPGLAFGGSGDFVVTNSFPYPFNTAVGTVVGGSGATTVNGAAVVVAGTGPMVFNSINNAIAVTNPLGTATINSAGSLSRLLLYANGITTYTFTPEPPGSYYYYAYGPYGNDTIIGQSGSVFVPFAANIGITGGSGGHNAILVGGNSTVTGGGDGDVILARDLGPQSSYRYYHPYGPGTYYVRSAYQAARASQLTAGPGAATISAAGFRGDLTITGGNGPNLLSGGDGFTTIIAGTGAATIAAGSSFAYGIDNFLTAMTATTFVFTAGHASTDLIQNFHPAQDLISLPGFPAGEAAAALAGATTANGSETLTLSDGTSLTFQNIIGLSPGNFV